MAAHDLERYINAESPEHTGRELSRWWDGYTVLVKRRRDAVDGKN